MTPNELRKLLVQDEHPKLDFKIDCSPARDEEWNELIKDILALANGNVGFSHLPGYLVIGASDTRKLDGSRELKDASHILLKKKDLLAKINGACTPRLPNLESDWVTLDGAKILVITISPTPHLYETKTSLRVPKRRFQEQTVFIRCGDEIQPATQQERDAILADKRRSATVWEKSVEPREEDQSWELITDSNLILPKLYNEENNGDPLAYHRIPYQPRDPERDVQLDLRAALSQTRYLLITGRSGLGKTREAAMLVRALMLEGYRVVRIKRGLLEVPREFPRGLQENHRRILILVDDLNFLFRTGESVKPRRADELPMPTLASYHDRLLETLDAFEDWCGESEIRVIATARDDTESWQVLNYSPKDRFWKRFTRFDLPVPKDSAVVDLLSAELANGNVQAEKNDFDGIARENDGTFANVVSNLRRVRMMEQSLTLSNYIATLEGSWRDVYERAVAKYPAVCYVYDAIELLQYFGIELYPWIVEPTTLLLWQGKRQQKATRQRRIKRALKYLVQDKIMTESDGKLAPRNIRSNALPFLEIIIQHAPDDFDARLVAASVHREIGNTEAMRKYCDEARELILPNDLYNLARLESILGNTDTAFEYLLRATEQDEFDPAKAQRDPDLAWIRDDPRFAEIVVVPTEMDADDDGQDDG
ncbi:MAG: putative DNA binding domain-containing protein [Chloroflexi bacterium]|nr:putative DNA binding domain-containing protein [Chloroflexota bacterium]